MFTITHHHHYDSQVVDHLDSQIVDLVHYHTHEVNAVQYEIRDGLNYHITETHSHDFPMHDPTHIHYASMTICLYNKCRFHYNDGHAGAFSEGEVNKDNGGE